MEFMEKERMYKIAVLMSTYNGEKYLADQINSLLGQEIENSTLDIFIRDDGSKDKTIDVLNMYKKDNHIHIDFGENVGPAKSFMYLVTNTPSNYDFYFFCDQDDVWDKNKITLQVNELIKHETCSPQIVFTNARIVDENLNIISKRNVYVEVPPTDMYSCSVAGIMLGCTSAFNRCLFEYMKTIDVINMKDVIMHDLFALNLCLAVGGSVNYFNYPTISYRQHSNNAIGVSYGLINKIVEYIHHIFRREKKSISSQAKMLLRLYENEMTSVALSWYILLARYPDSFSSRIKVALSKKYKLHPRHFSMKIRIGILLNNR